LPREAWQIVAKSAISASTAGDAITPQVHKTSKNSEIVNWWDAKRPKGQAKLGGTFWLKF